MNMRTLIIWVIWVSIVVSAICDILSMSGFEWVQDVAGAAAVFALLVAMAAAA